MQIPDREIVRKCKEYDPALSIEWCQGHRLPDGRYLKHPWFELWRKMENGKRELITPITKSIYDSAKPREFIEVDERLLWWIYEADSWRNGGSKKHALLSDARWIEWQKKLDRNRIRGLYDRAKDAWTLANAFYTTKGKSKNGMPKFNNHSANTPWLAPDTQARTSARLFSRSKANALAYNYKGK